MFYLHHSGDSENLTDIYIQELLALERKLSFYLQRIAPHTFIPQVAQPRKPMT